MKNKQVGFILITALIFLLVITILAVSLVNLNSTQTRMATNVTDTAIAFQSAEGALMNATDLLLNGTYSATQFVANGNGFYNVNVQNTPLWMTINWASGAVISGFKGGSAANSALFIEKMPSVILPGQNMKTPTQIYRVTVRGTGGSSNAIVLLQGTLLTQ